MISQNFIPPQTGHQPIPSQDNAGAGNGIANGTRSSQPLRKASDPAPENQIKPQKPDPSLRRRDSFQNPNIKYFVKRAIEFVGALKSLGNRPVVVTDQMLGFNSDKPFGPPQQGAALGFLYNSDYNATGSLADDIFSISAKTVGTVQGKAGNDVIGVDAEKVGKIQGDNGDDLIAVTARKIGQLDGGSGDDAIIANAKKITGVVGGGGNDAIAITAKNIGYVFSGDGNDQVLLAAQKIDRVFGGAGDDQISVQAKTVSNAGGGDGDDNMTIRAKRAEFINGGAGDDDITVRAKRIHSVNGGTGNDQMDISARKIAVVNGDAKLDRVDRWGDLVSDQPGGDDTIRVAARAIGLVDGGGGDDELTISAKKVGKINGGTGDDTINLNVGTALIRMGENAGNDIVNVERAGNLTISFAGAEAADIEVTQEGDRLILTGPAGDTLVINGVGKIAELSIIGTDWQSQPLSLISQSHVGTDLVI